MILASIWGRGYLGHKKTFTSYAEIIGPYLNQKGPKALSSPQKLKGSTQRLLNF
jgi:hypothetical protein